MGIQQGGARAAAHTQNAIKCGHWNVHRTAQPGVDNYFWHEAPRTGRYCCSRGSYNSLPLQGGAGSGTPRTASQRVRTSSDHNRESAATRSRQYG